MAARKRGQENAIPPLEWAAAIVGLVCVCGALGVTVWLGATRAGSVPDIALRAEAVSAVKSGFVVTISALNSGGTTAANVVVEGELHGPSGTVETSTMTFSYLVPRSERRGGLAFENDPRRHELKLKAKGYETP